MELVIKGDTKKLKRLMKSLKLKAKRRGFEMSLTEGVKAEKPKTPKPKAISKKKSGKDEDSKVDLSDVDFKEVK